MDDPDLEQDVAAFDRAQQAVLGSGVQNVYFSAAQAEAAVSIAAPFGQRDENLPLRGRDELLEKLADGGVHVVHGLGGCGKTRLALEAAYQAQQRGADVWWISATESGGLETSMRAVGRRLGISGTELEHGDAADLIWHRLSGLEGHWVLVMDNADDAQVLAGAGKRVADGRGWLRPLDSAAGTVLVTTRDGTAESWGPWCSRHRLAVLETDDAARVLADHARHLAALGSGDEARDLAERLGGLPLALKIAGAYLAQSVTTPPVFADPNPIRSYRQYQEAIDRGQLSAVFPVTQDEARELIGCTWDLTLDLLDDRKIPEARRLLRFLSCFADAPIPYQLILDPATMAASPLFETITGPRLWQVLQALDGFGLIDLGVDGESADPIAVVRLHPLVRDTSSPRPGTADGESAGCLDLAAQLLWRVSTAAETGAPDDPRTWPQWQLLAPHATHVFDSIASHPGLADGTHTAAANTVRLVGFYRSARGLYAQADAMLRRVQAVLEEALGIAHPEVLGTRHAIARIMAMRGDFAGAEAEYREALVGRLRVRGPESLETLATRHEIVLMMAARGELAGAEAELRDLLVAASRVLDREHIATLAFRHTMAHLVAARGDPAGAEAEMRDVLAARLRLLGPDHGETLSSRHEIATMMALRGDLAGAETELRDVLADMRRVLGPEHLSTLIARSEIAQMMAARGDSAGAEAEFREVLVTGQRVLGSEHPLTAETASWLDRLAGQEGGGEGETPG